VERAPGAGVSRVKCLVLGDGLMTREIFGQKKKARLFELIDLIYNF